MRVAFLAVILSVSTLLSSAAQQTSSASPQPLQILHQALAALTGTTPASDVTLSGTVQYIAGADDETGTAVLKAIATGASRVDLSLPSGQRSEVRNLTGMLLPESGRAPTALATPSPITISSTNLPGFLP